MNSKTGTIAELAQEIIAAAEQREDELLKMYREQPKTLELNPHEQALCMGAASYFMFHLECKKDTNTLSVLVYGYDTDRFELRDIPLSGTDYTALVEEKGHIKNELAPILKDWIDKRAQQTPAGGLYDMQVCIETRAFAPGGEETGYSNSVVDPKRLQTWLAYLKEAIQNKSYTQWVCRVNDDGLKTSQYPLAMLLLDELPLADISEFLLFLDKNVQGITLETHFGCTAYDVYLDVLEKRHLTPKEVEGIAAFIQNPPFKIVPAHLSRAYAVIIENGYAPRVPVAKTPEEGFAAFERALGELAQQLRAAAFTPTALEPGQLGQVYITLTPIVGAAGQMKVQCKETGKRWAIEMPMDISLAFPKEITFSRRDAELLGCVDRLADILTQHIALNAGNGCYFPAVDIGSELECISEKHYAAWMDDLQKYSMDEHARELPPDLRARSAAGLFEALIACPADVRRDVLSAVLAVLKKAKVKFKDSGYDSGLYYYFWRRVLGKANVDYPPEAQDGLVEIAEFYRKHGEYKDMGTRVLKKMFLLGNAKAAAAIPDYKMWHDEAYWMALDPKEMLDAKPPKPAFDGAVISAKRAAHTIAIWMREETEKAYAQALDFLLAEGPKAAKNAAGSDERFYIAIKFCEEPVFPDVVRFTAEDKYEGPDEAPGYFQYAKLPFGIAKTPELAFFAKAAQWPALWPKIEEYAQKMLKDEWYISDGDRFDTLLASPAVIALVLADEQYLDLAKQYAKKCGLDDGYETPPLCLIPAIKRRYGKSEKATEAIRALAGAYVYGDAYLAFLEGVAQ